MSGVSLTVISAISSGVKAHLRVNGTGLGKLAVDVDLETLEVAAAFHGITSSKIVPMTSQFPPWMQ